VTSTSHTAALGGARRSSGGRARHALEVSAGLAWRSLILVRRMPSVFLPSLVMPLFILVATSGAFRGISLLPAFDGASYLAFTIPLALVMGAGFAGMNAGMTLARDIEGGFVDRLVVSPAPRITLIAGPLMAAGLRSVFTTTVVLIAGLIGGVGLPGGLDTLALYLLGICFAAAAACWSMGVALRARTIQAAPLMQVVIFLAVFTSVAYAPRDVLSGWLATVADLNPVTYLLEASRAAELTGLGWAELWPALVALGALLAVLGTWALRGLASLGRR
jgi:ABC-2 type transport system permease protein